MPDWRYVWFRLEYPVPGVCVFTSYPQLATCQSNAKIPQPSLNPDDNVDRRHRAKFCVYLYLDVIQTGLIIMV